MREEFTKARYAENGDYIQPNLLPGDPVWFDMQDPLLPLIKATVRKRIEGMDYLGFDLTLITPLGKAITIHNVKDSFGSARYKSETP